MFCDDMIYGREKEAEVAFGGGGQIKGRLGVWLPSVENVKCFTREDSGSQNPRVLQRGGETFMMRRALSYLLLSRRKPPPASEPSHGLLEKPALYFDLEGNGGKRASQSIVGQGARGV